MHWLTVLDDYAKAKDAQEELSYVPDEELEQRALNEAGACARMSFVCTCPFA